MNTLLIFLGVFIFTITVIMVIGRIQKKRETRESIRQTIDSDDRSLDDLKPGKIDGAMQKGSSEPNAEAESIEDIQEKVNKIKEQVAQVKRTNELIKWEIDKNKILPAAKLKATELKKLNSEINLIQTPEELTQCKEKLISILNWFVKIENDYPGAEIMDNPKNLIQHVKNIYNDNLFRIAKDRFNDYSVKMKYLMSDKAKKDYTKQMFLFIDGIRTVVDIEAENYTHVFDKLKEIHYDIEEIYG